MTKEYFYCKTFSTNKKTMKNGRTKHVRKAHEEALDMKKRISSM